MRAGARYVLGLAVFIAVVVSVMAVADFLTYRRIEAARAEFLQRSGVPR